MKRRRIPLLLLVLLLLFTAARREKSAGELLLAATPEASYGSIGGEWAVIALSRGDTPVPHSYYDAYLDRLERTLVQKNGVLSKVKATDPARVTLALAALGEDAADFRGFDLVSQLKDVKRDGMQGLNGTIWSLIALSARDYSGTETVKTALRSALLAAQNPDGGYGMMPGDASDPDLTAMALTALAPCREDGGAMPAICAAGAYLERVYAAGEMRYSETVSQTLIAYAALEESEKAAQMREELETFRTKNGYLHDREDTEADAMATEQAANAIAAYERLLAGKTALYDMRDADK